MFARYSVAQVRSKHGVHVDAGIQHLIGTESYPECPRLVSTTPKTPRQQASALDWGGIPCHLPGRLAKLLRLQSSSAAAPSGQLRRLPSAQTPPPSCCSRRSLRRTLLYLTRPFFSDHLSLVLSLDSLLTFLVARSGLVSTVPARHRRRST